MADEVGSDRTHCGYFGRGVCRSCAEITLPYAEQCLRKGEHARLSLSSLGARCVGCEWEPVVASEVAGFRNRAKMVVSGTSDRPLLGILAEDLSGVDLGECLICAQEIRAAFPALREFIGRAMIPPYDVSRRRGELKYVLVTLGADGALMVRFVLRSTEAEVRIRKHMSWLCSELPTLSVVSINLQPRHAAIIEGDRETILLGDMLAMPTRRGPILLPPGAFFQTNTGVAEQLYETAAEWSHARGARCAVDLFCGVGGFALHLGAVGFSAVRGVELHPAAVAAGRKSAALWGLETVSFEAGDATALGRSVGRVSGGPSRHQDPARPKAGEDVDLVVVNPPRRGLGPELVAAIDGSAASRVIYSSCNVDSLVRDLSQLSRFRVERARVFDMFPHTKHYELLVALTRE
ncbi:MAG: 23S rRNA (uracil(747)-C(5))-methyltransferase [Candidatus Eisenbacteria bacterium]